MTKKKTGRLIALNRKARHNYELLEFFEAGIVLTGSEIKSVRAGEINFLDSYVTIRSGEAFLVGMHIAPYDNAGSSQHEPARDRKLLMHRKEINSLAAMIEQKGLTIVPVDMHFSRGRVKIELAVGRGKKRYDQREDLKRAAMLRDAEREMSSF